LILTKKNVFSKKSNMNTCSRGASQ